MLPRTLLALAALCALSAPAGAHPLPNFRYDRKIDVRLTRDAVEVRYVLEVSFWTIFTDPQKVFEPAEIERTQGKLREVSRIYCEKMAPRLAAGLDAKLGGAALAFKNTKLEVEQDRDHARFRYVFRAPWHPKAGPQQAFAFEERNFVGEIGAISLVLRADEQALDVKELIEPEDLRGKQPADYKPGDDVRARKASASLALPAGASEPTEPAPVPEQTVPVVEVKTDDSFWSGIVARGPKALFDTNLGTGALLLLAMMFGAFHAFAPGHGKSVAAAFLVGEQGTFRQAVLLAASTTFAHTGSVILIALLFRMRYRDSVPNDAQHWLGLVGGLLVLFVGMWLFMRRLRGQVDHFHLMGGCADMCGNHTARPNTPQCRTPLREAEPEVVALRLVPAAKNPLSWFRVVLLGIGAGAIPCVDAVLLLIVAVSTGQLAFALPLLLAFSIGLSGVLMLIGMAVVWLHRAGRVIGGDKPWFRFLPTASAVLLMAMGIWMARDAWKGFTTGVT